MATIAKRIVKPSMRDLGIGTGLYIPSTRGADGSKPERLAHSDSSRTGNRALRDTTNEILGVDELAALFNCSTEKIKRLARKKELPAFKIGKTWFVRERDLQAYVARSIEPHCIAEENV